MSKLRPLVRPLCVTACLCVAPLTTFQPAQALGRLDIALEGDQNDSLLGQLTAASLLKQAQNNGTTEAQDLFSSALADYQRLLETLYAEGYYSATIRIAIDGREAALIPPLSPPNTIDQIAVTVDPGPQFKFTTTSIAPIPADTDLPNGFQTGQIARSSDVLAAVRTSIDTWREDGHAKARVAQQSLEADHRAHTLSATVQIDPGPPLTFGALIPSGDSAVRPERIKAIAGLPTGQQFSPSELETAANRLRRTGAFQSVATTEAETPTPDQQLDIGVEVVDALPRRFGAGVELSTQDGLTLSGFWMHRNLLGGAERLRFDIEIAGIAGQSSGMDYALSTRFDRPAIYGADTAGFALLDVSSINEPSYSADAFKAGLGVSRIFGPGRTGELGLTFSYAETNDVYGARYFTLLEVPVSFQQDRRDTVLNPSSGHYLDVTLTPFIGLAGEQHGAQLKFDGRVYKALSPSVVAATRLQVGSVFGSSLAGTSPGYLFYSGGGGTVRGQSYQSLGVAVSGGTTGGRSFVGLSTELRAELNAAFSLVGFADAGYIGSESFYNGTGAWHAGAGLGVRYNTSVGPLRLDLAGPIAGNTSSGLQVYIGIGQAF